MFKLDVLLAFICFFCGPSKSYSQELVLGVSQLLEHFQPYDSIHLTRAAYLKILHRNIVTEDKDGGVVADLASRWKISSDFKRYDFCLPSAAFNNGMPITYSDVKYSLERMLNYKKLNFLSFHLVDNHSKLLELALDEEEKKHFSFCFRVEFANPVPNFLGILAFPHFSIVPKNCDTKCKDGAGAYVVEEFNPKEKRLVFRLAKDNSRYKVKRWIIKSLESARIPDKLVDELVQKKVDLFIEVSNYKNLPRMHSGYQLEYLDSIVVSHGLINAARPTMKNENFRHDFKKLLWFALNNYKSQVLTNQRYLIPPGLMPSSYYRQQKVEQDFVVKFVDRWQGKIKPATLRFISQGHELDDNAVRTIKDALGAVSLNFDYHPHLGEEERKLFDAHDFDVYGSVLGGLNRRSDFFLYLFDHYAFKTPESQEILSGKINLVKGALNHTDQRKRAELLSEQIQHIEDLDMHIPMFKVNTPIIVSNRIKIQIRKYDRFMNFDELSRSDLFNDGVD